MRAASVQARQAIPGVAEITWEADVLYGPDRLAEAVPLTDVQLSWDATAQVEATGSATVVRSPLRGDSWIPAGPGDMLAPFGAELAVTCRVRLGGVLDERIPVGVLAIDEVPDSAAGYAVLKGVTYVVGESIGLSFSDRMAGVIRDRFTLPESPTTSPTCYAELERLTGRTVQRTLPDRSIRSDILYDKERVEAVEQLAGILGGDAFFNAAGELQIRPDVPGATVATLDVSHVSPVSSALSTDGVYNGIVVTGKTEGGAEIRVERWVTSGPLEPDAWGRVPKFYHSDYLYTFPLVAAEADRQLAALAQPAARQVEADMLPNPLLELGDVVALRQPDGLSVTVRLTSIKTGTLWRIRGDVL